MYVYIYIYNYIYPVLGKYYLKEINGNRLYLSPKIQNEYIHILKNCLKENILERIQTADYFTIILDSTPDISHTDQMNFICRFIVVEKERCVYHFLVLSLSMRR